MIFCLTSNIRWKDNNTKHYVFAVWNVYDIVNVPEIFPNTKYRQPPGWRSRSTYLSFLVDSPLSTDVWGREKVDIKMKKKTHNAAWVLVFMRFYFICFTLKSFKFLNDKLVSFPFRLTMALNVLQSSNIGFWTWVGNNTLFYELYVLNLKRKKVNWVKIL